MRITTVLISTGFHIGARILQHACHSTHTRVRMPRHAYRSTHAGARISKYAYRSTRTGAPNGNGSAGQARPLPLDCFLQVRAQRPGASALCAVWAKPLSSLWASLLGARDGAAAWAPRAEMRCCDLLGASGHAVGHVVPGAPALPDAPGNSGKSPGAWDIAPPTERERQRGAGLEGERRGTRPCPLLSLLRHLVPLCFRSQSRSL